MRSALSEPAPDADGGPPPPPPTDAAVQRARRLEAGGEVEDCPVCMDTIVRETGCVTACGHPFCHECILEHVHRSAPASEDGAARCPICRTPVTPDTLFHLRTLLPPPPPPPAADGVGGGSSDGPSLSAEEEAPPPRSTKTKMVIEAVRQMLACDASSKCLVFSSYTKYLDVLQRELAAESLACARVDGSQRPKERERQMEAFGKAGVPVLLISLKCGVRPHQMHSHAVRLPRGALLSPRTLCGTGAAWGST